MLEFSLAGVTGPSALVALVIVLALVFIRRSLAWRSRSRGRPLPPGPPGLPIIGNMMNIPKFKPWYGYRDLSIRYGDIMHFSVLGSSIVVLGNADLMEEYLNKRSAITSSRKYSVLIELTGSDVSFAHMPYGSWWRRNRRVFWEHFAPQAIPKYNATREIMATKLLGKLLDDPLRFKGHLQYTFSATLLDLLYGIQNADRAATCIAKVQHVLEGISDGLVNGRYLVGVFPALRYLPDWLPGAGFQQRFASWRAASYYLKDVPVAHVQEEMERHGGTPCIVRDELSKISSSGIEGPAVAEEEEIVKGIAATAFAAGSETMPATLQIILLAVSLYPEVLAKAQAELDAVVGPTRLPDFGDRDSLVYVEAMIREALRWMPVAPLGSAHVTTEDDEFHGYFIPKGTALVPNVWACMHDPEVFPEPDVFRPERFIKDGKLDVSVRDPFQFAFGFGRRICAGRYYAQSTLFITVAAVLHVFDISPPVDEAGIPMKIKPVMTHGFTSHPQDCRCTIKPRSLEAEQLIRQSVQAAQAL